MPDLVLLNLPAQRGEAEIRDQHVAAAVEHDVGRLQIAVQHPLVVRGREAGAELARYFEGFVRGQTADAPQQGSQVLAIHVLHGEELHAVDFPDVVNAADVGMGHLARDPDLVAEPRQCALVFGNGLGEELQRDRLAEFEIGGAVHLAHAALAQQRDDTVPFEQQRAGREAAFIRRARRAEQRSGGSRARARRFGDRVGLRTGGGRSKRRGATPAEPAGIGVFRGATRTAGHRS